MTYYYIVPAQINYVKDANGINTEVLESITPSVTAGKWVADCKDNVNYLLKTNAEISGCEPILEDAFDSVVSAIGFDPAQVRLWNGGW